MVTTLLGLCFGLAIERVELCFLVEGATPFETLRPTEKANRVHNMAGHDFSAALVLGHVLMNEPLFSTIC